MKRTGPALLILLALLTGCVATPVVPPTAAPTALTQSTLVPATVGLASPVPATPGTPTTAAPATVAPEATAAVAATTAAPSSPERPTTVPTEAPRAVTTGAAPIAVATVARPTVSPVTTAAVPSPASIGSTEVITPENASATTYRVSDITLPTYPYEQFLTTVTDPAVDYPALSFDRSAYSASNPRPAPHTYKLLTLENRYLRVSLLPELGGRIYECVFKPTGANEFYANPVVKPTEWGPASPPNVPGANWWLSAGGMEWGFPVEEHGYEFGTEWGYDHAAQDDGGVMITVYTKTGPDRPVAMVDIILPPDTSYFVIQPRVYNPLGKPFRFKFWSNAMLAPGQANTTSPELRFILPVTEMTVHSTGDTSLPQAGQSMSWPVVDGRDLSQLGNWRSYLGAFARPAADNGSPNRFAAVYDASVEEGVVRVYPPQLAEGLKIFAPAGLDPKLWTDDGSSYVELHGGLEPTFNEWHELGPGDDVTWSEFWYPVAGIGGVTFANERAALSLAPANGKLRLGLFPTEAIDGKLTVTVQGGSPVALDVAISPEHPYLVDLVLPAGAPSEGEAAVTLVDGSDSTIFEWGGRAQLR